MKRKAWTFDQLVKVLALYCQIPFGKMHARNPAVALLATSLGRTPSAVALKLVNFASLDPELQGRGVAGMSNVSRLDRQVWAEFYGRWDRLAESSDIDLMNILQGRPSDQESNSSPPSGPNEVQRQMKVRRGQSFFRAAVMAAYDWKCCVTGIAAPELLRASHIVPWSENVSLRLNPHNGLCLNAIHDAAFDRGLITFSANLELCVSSRLRKQVPVAIFEEMFESHCDVPIAKPERYRPVKEMLEYHRDNIFLGE